MLTGVAPLPSLGSEGNENVAKLLVPEPETGLWYGELAADLLDAEILLFLLHPSSLFSDSLPLRVLEVLARPLTLT